MNRQQIERDCAIYWARELTAGPFLVLATECSWEDGEIRNVAVLDENGQIVLQLAVAQRVNGVLRWSGEARRLRELLAACTPLVYDGIREIRALEQASHRSGIEMSLTQIRVINVMTWVAAFHGDWNRHREEYRCLPLAEACDAYRINVPPAATTALREAEMLRRLIWKMASMRMSGGAR